MEKKRDVLRYEDLTEQEKDRLVKFFKLLITIDRRVNPERFASYHPKKTTNTRKGRGSQARALPLLADGDLNCPLPLNTLEYSPQ
jgi:hypothetical protein